MFKRHWLPIALVSAGAVTALVYGLSMYGAANAPKITSSRHVRSPGSAAASNSAAAHPSAVALSFRPEDGQTLAYQYDMRSFSDVDVAYLLKVSGASSQASNASSGERQRIEVSSHGTLNLKFYASPDGGWNVGAKVSNLKYLMGDQTSPESRAMEQPFAFSFQSDGSVSGFTFTPGISTKAQSAIKQILSWFQVVAPKEPRATWFGRETDATGTFQTQYSLLDVNGSDATVAKKKLNYLSLATSLIPAAKDTLASILSSKISYQLPLAGAWITSATVEERLSLSTRGRSWGNVESTGSIQSLSADSAVSWPPTFDSYLGDVQSTTYLSNKYYETDPTLDSLWANLNTQEAIERFQSMWAKDHKLSEALMVNFLRQKPSRSAELVRRLDESTKRDTGIDEMTRLTLWRLNAKAGHKEAQKAQLDAAMNSSMSRTTRMNALAHLDFENPEPFVVEQAVKFRRSTLGATDRSERELGSMALLSLGAMGDATHPNPSMNATIAKNLVGYLETTRTTPDTVTTLQAIGNSGNPVTIEAIKPYLNSKDEAIRVNALEAFRRMDNPQAAGAVIESFENNPDPVMRAAAIRSLSTMPATEETMAWGRTTLTTAMTNESLAQLAGWLGSQASHFPENANALRRLLQTTTSFDVKRSILKYVSP